MICIIPARKGSKGLKGKNNMILNSKPLVSHTIDIAKKCKKIKRIIVSTDDDKIIKLCKNIKNVETPFKRPSNLSKDNSLSVDVYLHCIKFLKKKEKINYENFCVMLPTCPIRNPKDIDQAIKIFLKKKLNFLVSATETKPVEYTFNLDNKNFIIFKDFNKTKMFNRQKLKKTFSPNGSLYIFKTKELEKHKSFLTKQTYFYKMKKVNSLDIDDYDDFNMVKKLI
jgi:CMP-N,N'-diacetyllegionaminic acid synthase